VQPGQPLPKRAVKRETPHTAAIIESLLQLRLK
jgi:hypothetical protein